MGILLVVIVGSDFINLLSRFILEPGQNLMPDVPNYLVSLYILVVTFLFCQRIFRLSEEATTLISTGVSVKDRPSTNGNSQANVDPALLEKIEHTMEGGKLYTRTSLTIAKLAESLSIQEYRL
jgi:hypothetical protein